LFTQPVGHDSGAARLLRTDHPACASCAIGENRGQDLRASGRPVSGAATDDALSHDCACGTGWLTSCQARRRLCRGWDIRAKDLACRARRARSASANISRRLSWAISRLMLYWVYIDFPCLCLAMSCSLAACLQLGFWGRTALSPRIPGCGQLADTRRGAAAAMRVQRASADPGEVGKLTLAVSAA